MTLYIIRLCLLFKKLPGKPFYQAQQFPENFTVSNANLEFIPSSWDWRQKGAIGPVQDQGMLGDVQTIVASGKLLSSNIRS